MRVTFLDLPVEIIDQILQHVLGLPQLSQVKDARFEDIDTRELLETGLLRTSHFLRNRTIQVMRNDIVWIRVGFGTPRWSMYQMFEKLEWLPVVPAAYRPVLEQGLSTIDLLIGSSTFTDASNQFLSSFSKSLLIPFSHRVWLELVNDIQDLANGEHPLHVRNLGMRTTMCSQLLQLAIDIYVLPAFLSLQRLYITYYSGCKPKLVGDERKETEHWTDHISIQFENLRLLQDRVHAFESRGRTDDAGLVALYSAEQLAVCLSSICRPIKYGTKCKNEHVLHNEAAHIFHALELRAFQAFHKIYERKGVSWAQANEKKLSLSRSRWLYRLKWAGFPLRLLQRANLFEVMGAAFKMHALIGVGLDLHAMPTSAPPLSIEFRDAMRGSLRWRLLAKWLRGEDHVECPEDENLINWYGPDFYNDHGFLEIHNAMGTGYLWAGHESLLSLWGGKEALRYLPIASIRAEAEGVSPDSLQDARTDGNIMRCRNECQCITF